MESYAYIGGFKVNMKKMLVLLLVLILSISVFTGCTSSTDDGETEGKVDILVSAAASMTDVLNELWEKYKQVDPDTNITFTFGSSGALQTQIEEGAPADIFMSAAQKQMDALEEKDLIVNESRKTLLLNNVVLITPKDSTLDIKSFEDLTRDDITKIALGEPSSVPVGQYSEEIFTSLGSLDQIKAKAVYGSDVRTVLTWVESGEVDAGVVYATDAAVRDQIKIITEAPEGSHKEVSYPVAVVKSSENPERAQEFLDYLSTDEAIELFEKYGFAMK